MVGDRRDPSRLGFPVTFFAACAAGAFRLGERANALGLEQRHEFEKDRISRRRISARPVAVFDGNAEPLRQPVERMTGKIRRRDHCQGAYAERARFLPGDSRARRFGREYREVEADRVSDNQPVL